MKKRIFISVLIAVVMLLLSATVVLAAPGNVENFTANPADTSIILTWTKASSSTSTVIRYSTTGYPSDPTDGTSAYSGTSFQTTLSGLTAGTAYYFCAWGYDDVDYSPSPAQLIMNTTGVSELDDGDDIPVPTLPSEFSQTPDASGASNLDPFYTMTNNFIADWGMPTDNGWVGLFLVGVVVAGFGVYVKLKEIFIALAVVEFLIVVGVVLIDIPSWMIIIPILVGLGVWGIERYYQ